MCCPAVACTACWKGAGQGSRGQEMRTLLLLSTVLLLDNNSHDRDGRQHFWCHTLGWPSMHRAGKELGLDAGPYIIRWLYTRGKRRTILENLQNVCRTSKLLSSSLQGAFSRQTVSISSTLYLVCELDVDIRIPIRRESLSTQRRITGTDGKPQPDRLDASMVTKLLLVLDYHVAKLLMFGAANSAFPSSVVVSKTWPGQSSMSCGLC